MFAVLTLLAVFVLIAVLVLVIGAHLEYIAGLGIEVNLFAGAIAQRHLDLIGDLMETSTALPPVSVSAARAALRLACREVAHISFLVTRQADTLKQRGNLLRREPLTILPRPESQIRGHCPREEICDLHNHADATPQHSRCQFR